MSGKFGGGGVPCTICAKTVYAAETILLEKKPYHAECFKCTTCNKRLDGPSQGQVFEESVYCRSCFAKNGFAQKQKKVVWVKKESTGTTSGKVSKFGGGGVKCTVCSKTVYPAEQVSYEKKPYHGGCFECSFCKAKLTPNSAAEFEDTLMCTKCFNEKGYRQKQVHTTKKSSTTNALASKFGGGGTKCQLCEKTVYQAEALSFEKQVYHAACFKCSECSAGMTASGGNQYENKLFCSKCFQDGGYRQKQAAVKPVKTTTTSNKLASRFGGGGNKCVTCDKTVYPAETLSYEKQCYHVNCFKCSNCDAKISNTSSAEHKKSDGGVTIYCKKCWGELGLNRAQLKTD